MSFVSDYVTAYFFEDLPDNLNLENKSENIKLKKAALGLNHFFIFCLGPFLYLWICYRKNLISFLNFKHFPPQFLLLFPIALFSLYPTMGFLAQIVKKLDIPDFLMKFDNESLNYLPKLLEMNTIWDLVTNIFIVGVLAGIGEELLFRGILQKEIEIRSEKPHVAIWVSAIIFSALHLQVIGFLPKLLIGVVLGYAYYFSGSLVLPMIIHFLNNSFLIVSLYTMGNVDLYKDQVDTQVSLLSLFISLGLFSWLFFVIYRNRVGQKLVYHG